MNKLLAALIAAAFATSGFAAAHAAKEMKKDEAKPAVAAASAASAAKKDEAKPAAKADEKKKEEPKK